MAELQRKSGKFLSITFTLACNPMLHMLLICWYQVVPGPRRGGSLENRTRATGNQWPMWKFLRCRSNDVLKLCEVHQRMSKWLLRCQWNDMKESVHNWVSELMNKWIDKPRNQWTSQSMTQRITEATKQWLNESSNQWTNESMSQWIKDSMNQWLHDSESQWITESPESVNQGSNESMNEAIQSNSSSNSDLIPSVFVIFQHKANSLKCTCCSRYSLVHILPTASSKSAPRLSVLQHFEVEIEHVLQSWALFVNHFRR